MAQIKNCLQWNKKHVEKDVERLFGVLQSRFTIVARLARLHVVSATIEEHGEMLIFELEMVVDIDVRFQEFYILHKNIKDKDAYNEVWNALIEYLWMNITTNLY